ncbi:MAG: hypothetical protein JSW10_04030 [Pseudomonadota bacterium]|nr:MAG: hypothetical protein JSW10_04030 [Pseudomonadota bacterium]
MARHFTRRNFFRLCASAAALVGAHPHLLANSAAPARRYERVRLVDTTGQPLKASQLTVGENYLFHYPYISTPSFLIDLGTSATAAASLQTESGESYQGRGGVGPSNSIVAVSALCAHRMSHPARSVSFINYRHQQVSFANSKNDTVQRERVIYCCSEKSVYDPAQGARVLGGPAPQPLAAILLDYDAAEDSLFATGTNGGEMFERFFGEFAMRLSLEFNTTDIQTPVTKTAAVLPLAEYCKTQVLC